MLYRLLLVLGVFAGGALPVAQANDLAAAGSPAAGPVYEAWAEDWLRKAFREGNRHRFNYTNASAATALQLLREGKLDFAAAEVALPQDVLDRFGLVMFPTAVSGVVPVVGLPMLPRGELKLTGSLLADIFAGRITRWDAPQIAALNRGLKLPKLPIIVVARQDEASATYVFTHYLSKVSPEWARDHGAKWFMPVPSGGILVDGTRGVVAAVHQNPGTIGFAEFVQTDKARLNYARIQNHRGEYPIPSPAAFVGALAGSEWAVNGKFEDMLTDMPGGSAWPITSATFIYMRKLTRNIEHTAATLSFFGHGFLRGRELTASRQWVPLPDTTQARVVKEMGKIRDEQGVPINWHMPF